MADVFINYRTGDGEETATTLERDLTRRFGAGRIFRASQSIQPGEFFDDELLTAVRRSSLLIAVIGKEWAGSPRLQDPKDWVRKEIVEAFRCAIPVVPVLVGRGTDRLDSTQLPRALGKLARCHSVRFDTQNAEYDILRIGDFLAKRLPELAAADRADAPSPVPESGSVHHTVQGDVGEWSVQARDITGDIGGTVIREAHGPVHTGTGDQHLPHLSGDGAQYVAGDHHGGVHQQFGSGRRSEAKPGE
ncbi:toll/interleukin-1 receptor domain-containing protein [Streptomyces beijiangensis]|uniref:Toll/interleukin-1 receptor domain-containing protein n=1 Tax=Streptomyces beijiangensis TaxID=163361 RepID=A0A939F4S6_9ACTN|nr:toll/interleukin-1 receptor domain-containing protein [Streptomyces beijiangensis]MBO0511903.1 toll/interleukin-1 receptor domain-containing protein [Streptomyces beijiangensis]